MCGIAGIITREAISQKHIGWTSIMNAALVHRGPDGEGGFSDSHVALTMRRLSIIDLSGGWQPLYNEDHSLALVANGEIYNYLELRAQLKTCGHRFATGSDCETIVHLYEQYGFDCVNHLRGMFTFALWDSKRLRLLLGRDRMGEKPLYLYESEGQLTFASELKALLSTGLVPFELEPSAVDLYFHYHYVPEPWTPIKGVRKLDAAHLMIVDVNPWRVTETCYWRMEDAAPLEGDPAQLIRQELETISEIVIRSDVPVGVALSGGLDSSAVAALASRKYPGSMHAFSVGYPGELKNDERADARLLAESLDVPFHDVELDTDEMVAFFPELVYWRDDPIADIAGYGYYSVMKLAQEHGVPVVLQGHGGDELFWGYDWVVEAVKQSKHKLSLWRKGWGALPCYLGLEFPPSVSAKGLSRWIRDWGGLRTSLERFGEHRKAPVGQMVFYDAFPDFRRMAKSGQFLYSESFCKQLAGANAAHLFTLSQPWEHIEITLTRLICSTYLRENGITQGDRLSMASSIELRLPLMDHRLVETIIGLRKTKSDAHQPAKSWFRAAVRDVLPEWVMNRPKRGFVPPVREWEFALIAAYGASLRDGYLVQSGVLDGEMVCRLTASTNLSAQARHTLFKLLVLEQWCRQMSTLARRCVRVEASVS